MRRGAAILSASSHMQPPARASAVIVGGGIIGAACAYHLTRRGVRDVVIIERAKAPLEMTSARSTEAFREFFDSREMIGLCSRSIEGIEQIAASVPDKLGLNPRGYLYVARTRGTSESFVTSAQTALDSGSLGTLRRARTAAEAKALCGTAFPSLIPTGYDLYETPEAATAAFPFLANTPVMSALHARRAGWLDAHRLGSYYLEEARAKGARLLRSTDAVAATQEKGQVTGLYLRHMPSGWDAQSDPLPSSSTTPHFIETPVIINASGPFLADTHRRLWPHCAPPAVYNELHPKISFQFPPTSSPATASAAAELSSTPMTISCDATELDWTDADRADIEAAVEDARSSGAATDAALLASLLGPVPSGLHGRPLGRNSYLALWEFVHHNFPYGGDRPDFNVDQLAHPLYLQLIMRAMPQLIPSFGALFPLNGPRPVASVDGGYYCTAEGTRVPLVGRVPDAPNGAFMCGAFRGVGIMNSFAAGELLASYVAGDGKLPSYANELDPLQRAKFIENGRGAQSVAAVL